MILQILLLRIAVWSTVNLYYRKAIGAPPDSQLGHKSNNLWDNALQQHGFFRRLMHLFPALFICNHTGALRW